MALISYIDYTLTPSAIITGANWTAELPVANLAPYDLGQPSRSTTTDVSISIDLGAPRQVGVLAIPKHSLSLTATWRIRASDNVLLITDPSAVPANDIIYDSNAGSNSTISYTTINVLAPPTYLHVLDNLYFKVGDQLEVVSGTNFLYITVTSFDNLTKELGFSVQSTSLNAFTGASWVVSRAATKQKIWGRATGFGSEEWGQFTWDGSLISILNRPPALKLLDTDISAQYFILEISDVYNIESYIDLHKLVVGPSWRTSTDISLGYAISYEDTSKVTRSRGGQSYVNLHPKYRKFKVTFKGLPRKEVYSHLVEIDRLLGTGTPLLLCLDPEDVPNLGNKSVYGSQAIFNSSRELAKDFMEKPLIIEEWV